MDFINDVNKEKKTFERTLDDCVANGMDRGIQVNVNMLCYAKTNDMSMKRLGASISSRVHIGP